MRTDCVRMTAATLIILLTGGAAACLAAEMQEQEEVWVEDRPGPEGPEQRRWVEPGPEQVEMLLRAIREKDPPRADALARLREENPEAFRVELRKAMREQLVGQMRERGVEHRRLIQPGQEPAIPGGGAPGREMIRERMQERNEEYLKWLKENYPDEAEKLERLKAENPEQYWRALGLSMKKYGEIAEASRHNPELAKVMKERMVLKDRRAELLRQIRSTTDEQQKKALVSELNGVVGQQFDLIVKRKQIAYEDLAKKLEELKKEVDQRKAEVEKWKGADFKKEQVKQRVDELLSETEKFEWE